jgi:hypothetical protein
MSIFGRGVTSDAAQPTEGDAPESVLQEPEAGLSAQTPSSIGEDAPSAASNREIEVAAQSAADLSSAPKDDVSMHAETTETRHISSFEEFLSLDSEAMLREDKESGFVDPNTLEDPLYAPKPREGFVQRWVRSHVHGVEDHGNLKTAERLGYAPRNPANLTEHERAQLPIRTVGSVSFIQIEDLVLCEIPVDRYKRNLAVTQNRTDRQFDAVMEPLREESRRSQKAGFKPVQITQSSRVHTGGPRRPPVMDD